MERINRIPRIINLRDYYKSLHGRSTPKENLGLLIVKSVRASEPIRLAEELLLGKVKSGELAMDEARFFFTDLLEKKTNNLLHYQNFGEIAGDLFHGKKTKNAAVKEMMQFVKEQDMEIASDFRGKHVTIYISRIPLISPRIVITRLPGY